MNDASKMYSIRATLSQNMDFIKEEHATAYLSSILDFTVLGSCKTQVGLSPTYWDSKLVSPSRVKLSTKKAFLLGHIDLLDITS
jgi:hypothetical protein